MTNVFKAEATGIPADRLLERIVNLHQNELLPDFRIVIDGAFDGALTLTLTVTDANLLLFDFLRSEAISRKSGHVVVGALEL